MTKQNETVYDVKGHIKNQLFKPEPTRNEVIEEIAAELERFTFAFGADTVASFTVFIRGLKD
jgi:hypothetical protein